MTQVTNALIDQQIKSADLATAFENPPKTALEPEEPAPIADLDDQLTALIQYFEESEDSTQDSRKLSERDRDYYDHIQWTAEEVAILKKRKQPIVTINYVQRKVEYMRGFERKMRSDPKAFPRTPQDEETAGAATDALRYVADQNDFDETRSSVHENLIIEGFGGADVTVTELPDGTTDVVIDRVPWDRLVIDPHSRLPDFSDSQYKGIVIWMDGDKAKDAYPGYEDSIDGTYTSVTANDTYGDRPGNAWCDSKRKRVRVVQMHYLWDGEWMVATFTKGGFLSEPTVSPYVDKFGRSVSSLILRSAYINRKNERYGAVRSMISIQDEINKRRSKALHLLSQRQTYGNKTALQDTQAAKLALAQPDGHIELNGNAIFGQDFGVLPTGDMAAGQFQLLEHATREMQASGPNAAMAGKDPRSQSGRALEAQAQGGSTEMEPLVDELRQWTRDVYEAAWLRIKQFWKEPTWVRVTDDDRNIKFVGLNKQITVADRIAQMDPQMRAQWMQQQQIQPNDPRLQEVIGVENDVSGLDVDIVIEEGPNIAALMSEQFEVLAGLAKNGVPIPPKALIQASSIKPDTKKQILDEMEKGQQLPPEVQKQMAEMQQQLESLSKENEQLKGDRNIELAKLALENKKVDQDARNAQPAPQEQPPLTPKDMADIRLKEAQAVKTLADAEQSKVETAQKVAELNGLGVSTEMDEEGNPIPLPPSAAEVTGQQTLAQVQQLAQMQEQLAQYMMAPRSIVRDAMGNPVGVQVGEVVRPVITGQDGQIEGMQ